MTSHCREQTAAHSTIIHCTSAAIRVSRERAYDMDSTKRVAIADLIGIPFEFGGRGPDSFDCYGLLMEMYSRIGKSIPDYGSASKGATIIAMMLGRLSEWKEVVERPGTALLIKLPKSMHVGFVLPYGKFIHTNKMTGGVTIESLRIWTRRILGYYEPL